MKCNTWFISSVCYHLSILVLHFKFLSYHYFNCFCFHILVTFTFFLFKFSRVIIVSYCTLFFNFQIVTSLYVRPWRKEAVPSEILVKNIIYIPDCKISHFTSIESTKLILSFDLRSLNVRTLIYLRNPIS